MTGLLSGRLASWLVVAMQGKGRDCMKRQKTHAWTISHGQYGIAQPRRAIVRWHQADARRQA
eukprot:6694882-Karenia_brevis.AAC.1